MAQIRELAVGASQGSKKRYSFPSGNGEHVVGVYGASVTSKEWLRSRSKLGGTAV